ncbi:MAG: alanine racemase [Spirochaetaceae bacterium]|nr:MAG: alanine racemase [Spirochaetaceae bacterium]
METSARPGKATISLEAIKHNFRSIMQGLPPITSACAAVKANAYGHGAIQAGHALLAAGADMLGVASAAEGIELRQNGLQCPILIFGPFFPCEAEEIARFQLTPFIADRERLKPLSQAAAKTGTTVKVFLKIDTGMGRVGCDPADAPALALAIHSSAGLQLAGTATHLAAADTADPAYTRQQLATFQQAINGIRENGMDPGIISAGNSGATITATETALFDLVRPGISLYGYFPSHEVPRELSLLPAMTFESAVSFIKKVPAGTHISYGMTYTTKKPTTIATIPIGYADGWARSLSNRGTVWINGSRYPIAGKICMDQFMIDLGLNSNVSLYDRVVLFGPPQGERFEVQPATAEDIADICGTIPYEITCGISGRIPRVYQEADQKQVK